jgi:hypothetical protein
MGCSPGMKAAVLSIALVACAARPAEPLSNRVRPVAAEPAPAPPPGIAATLARLDQFSHEMCSCPDRDCVERVVDDMSRWVHELASAGEANPHVNVLQDARAKAAAERVSRCMAVVYARRTRPASAP